MNKTDVAAISLGLCCIAGCTTLPEGPVFSETFPVAYDRLAACSYDAVNREDSVGLRFTVLRAINAAAIKKEAISSGPVPMWEARFTKAGNTAASVMVKAYPSVWGSATDTRQIISTVQACAASLQSEPHAPPTTRNRER